MPSLKIGFNDVYREKTQKAADAIGVNLMNYYQRMNTNYYE